MANLLSAMFPMSLASAQNINTALREVGKVKLLCSKQTAAGKTHTQWSEISFFFFLLVELRDLEVVSRVGLPGCRESLRVKITHLQNSWHSSQWRFWFSARLRKKYFSKIRTWLKVWKIIIIKMNKTNQICSVYTTGHMTLSSQLCTLRICMSKKWYVWRYPQSSHTLPYLAFGLIYFNHRNYHGNGYKTIKLWYNHYN